MGGEQVAADENGKSKGYGFVHFESEDSAKQAIERVNGMQIGEKTVEVTPFVRRALAVAVSIQFTFLVTAALQRRMYKFDFSKSAVPVH